MNNERDSIKTKREQEVERLRQLVDRRPGKNDTFEFGGVLLSDAIERCVRVFDLIKPFNPDNLKPACYKLTIGDEYAVGRKISPLSDDAGKNQIKIPPFEVAIIKTHETINMPRFLIARWNIQVSRAYQGLLWVGGPQVDAGYVGHLFCPIYNLSDQGVSLFKGEPIAVIDFAPTSEYHQGRSKDYKFPPDLVLFEEYKPDKLVSGLVSQAKVRLDKVEAALETGIENSDKRIEDIRQRADNFISLTIAIVAILFASISVTAVGKESPPWPYMGVFLLSGFASFFAASAWLESKSEGRLFRRSIRVIVLIGLGLAFLFHMFWIYNQGRHMEKLEKEIFELKKAQFSSSGAATKTPVPPEETVVPGAEKPPLNKIKP